MDQLNQKSGKVLTGLGNEEYRDIEFLRKLGYCEQNIAYLRLFYDLIEEVEWCMIHRYSNEDIRELLNNKESFIYVELKMYHDIGLNRIPDYIMKVYKERQIAECDVEVYTDVFGNNLKPSFNDTVISIASYKCQKKEVGIVESSKLYSPVKKRVKKKDSMVVPSTIAIATVNM